MKSLLKTVQRVLAESRAVFAAFRRTRPFWGGLWTIVAGLWIIRMMQSPIALALNGGWDYSAGYIIGGLLVAFGLLVWIAPLYRALAGVAAFLLAIAAFPAANLGGFLIGSLVGVFGSSLILSWGQKKSRREVHHEHA